MTKPQNPRPAPIQPDLEIVLTAEQLQRHIASQPPLLDPEFKCGKCAGWPLLVMPHDNADPSAIRAACAKCGKVSRFIGTAQQETEGL